MSHSNPTSTAERSEFVLRQTLSVKTKRKKRALIVLLCLILTALLAPLLANEKPLYLQYKGGNYFPAFWDLNPFAEKNYYSVFTSEGKEEKLQLDITQWKKLKYDRVLWCPITYSPGKSDLINSNFVSPFDSQWLEKSEKLPLRFRHFLGTGVRGEDVLSGLIHGTRTSLFIGIVSMLLAACIGLLLGALAGYFGDDGLMLSRTKAAGILLGLFCGYFYGFYVRSFQLNSALAESSTSVAMEVFIGICILLISLLLFYKLAKLLEKTGLGAGKFHVPIDSLISRLIEITSSLPTFILILSLAAISKASFFNLLLILSLSMWTGIARLTRAEILRIKKLDYIQAAKSLGYSETRILFQHALRNGISPALVAISFGVAASILTESSLSFLGIGLPIETVSWGSMLTDGRAHFSAWWMTLFPGIAIFITVTCFHLLGDGLRKSN